MTETDWETCQDPAAMLAHLGGRASERKMRLFAVACCRRIWGILEAAQAQRAVLVAEQYADGATTADALEAACRDAAWHVRLVSERRRPTEHLQAAAETASWSWQVSDLAACVAGLVRRAMGTAAAGRTQAALLRCLVGKPGVSVSLAPGVLAWQGSTVVKMAAAIYEGRKWEDMPVLGDALEEAGCSDRTVLDHCRSPGPHARGCHIVDVVLGRT